jgi:hypothetical protein
MSLAFIRMVDGNDFESILVYLTWWAVHTTTFSILMSIYASYRDDPQNDYLDYKTLANWTNGMAQCVNIVVFFVTSFAIYPVVFSEEGAWDTPYDIYS